MKNALFPFTLLCLLPLAATEVEEPDLGPDEQRAYQPTEFLGNLSNGMPVLRAGSLLQQPPVVTGECFSVKMGEVFHVDVLVADSDMPDTSFLPMEAESDAEVWQVIP